MRKLLNTLYLTDPDYWVHADNGSLVIKKDGKKVARFPILQLDSVACFNYMGMTPDAIKLCNENKVYVSYFTPYGKFIARWVGDERGSSIHLRKRQFAISLDEGLALGYAKEFVATKIYNTILVVKSFRGGEHRQEFSKVEEDLNNLIRVSLLAPDTETLLGVEGVVSAKYFGVFNYFIKNEDFEFRGRTKRPPEDEVNAVLSYLYTLVTFECESALHKVGLDPFCGFYHKDRSGRASLACDLVEEFRAVWVDRLTVKAINLRQISKDDFEVKENGATLLNDGGRKKILGIWQKKKQDEVWHPYLEENIKVGLIPYAQAQLLARAIRGDLGEYPPFLWGE